MGEVFQRRGTRKTKTTNTYCKARSLGSFPAWDTMRTCRAVGRKTDLSLRCGALDIPSTNPDIEVNNCLWNLCGEWESSVFDQNDGPSPIGSSQSATSLGWTRGWPHWHYIRLWNGWGSLEKIPGDRVFHGQSPRLKRVIPHSLAISCPSLSPC